MSLEKKVKKENFVLIDRYIEPEKLIVSEKNFQKAGKEGKLPLFPPVLNIEGKIVPIKKNISHKTKGETSDESK